MWARIRAGFHHDKPVLPAVVMGVLLFSLPNLLTAFWPRFNEGQAETFWMSVGIILLPCVFSIPVRTTFYGWLPFAAFIPATLVYSFITQSPLREWAFVVLMETDWRELGRFWEGAAAAVILGPLTVWFLWRFISRKMPPCHRLSGLSRAMILLLALVVPVSTYVKNSREIGSLVMQRKLSTAFPIGLLVSAWSARNIRHKLDNRGAIERNLARPICSHSGREIYVLVIGESARFGSFQINGYGRETTPLLAKTPGLLSFQDVIAPATVTLMSVPLLLTPATAHRLGKAANMPSVVGLFRRAGFHTAWFSTQKRHGMYDTASSIYANDADEARFLSGNFAPGAGTYGSAYDGALLQPVRDLLQRQEGPLLIVLHTMGSHQHYCDRFPPAFNHFPSYLMRYEGNPFTGKFNAEQQRNLTNAYDNSILYTDWVLSQLIEALAATHAVSALYYVSDHGQNTGNAPVLPFAHGSMTRDVLHVPLLLWLSPEYRKAWPEPTRALESHVHTPLSADTTFHTLLDMAGLDCALLDRSHSAASASFNPGPRMVRNMEGGLVDYDRLHPQHAKQP